MNVIVAAPGESLTEDVTLRLFDHYSRKSKEAQPFYIAVCDAYQRIFYDAIVANDSAWWRERPEALNADCRKFSTRTVNGVEQLSANALVDGGSSSGVVALWAARNIGATRILMVGFDHRGSHFFGKHTGNLKNTPTSRWPIFTEQFKRMAYQLRSDGIQVLNCTPGTALDVFPKADLGEGLQWLQELRAA